MQSLVVMEPQSYKNLLSMISKADLIISLSGGVPPLQHF